MAQSRKPCRTLAGQTHPPHAYKEGVNEFYCPGVGGITGFTGMGGNAGTPVPLTKEAQEELAATAPEPERVHHPAHYSSKVPGIECIQVVQHFNFNQGNVIKYVWRAGDKGDIIEDLLKARQYLDFEIERIRAQQDG